MFPAYFNVTLEELKHLILNIAAEFFLNFPFLRKMKSEETVSVGQKTKQKKKTQRWQGHCRQGKPTVFL